jgi:hypothetical protein
MQEETKKVDPFDHVGGTGILGRANDILQKNGYVINGINVDQAAIALDGVPGHSTPPIVVSSARVTSFADRPDGSDWKDTKDEMYFDIEGYTRTLNAETDGFSGIFGDRWSDVLLKGIEDAKTLKQDLNNAIMAGSIWGNTPGDWDEVSLWRRFKTVAALAQTHESRSTDRDVFYVECTY